MTVVCAWCEKVMREGAGPVSHGICTDCVGDVELSAAPVVLMAEPPDDAYFSLTSSRATVGRLS